MKKRALPTILLALVGAVFLVSCGGGTGLNPDPKVRTVPDVTSIKVERFVTDEQKKEEKSKPVYYSGKVTLTLTGTNLDQELTVRFTKCVNLEEVADSATALERVYTCTLRGVGYLPIEVLTTNELSRIWISKIYIPLPQVAINTNQGSFTFELYPDSAPKTVDNFLQYVSEKFYTNTLFHRVIASVMIQGGGFDAELQAKATHDPIKLERTGMSNLRGTIAMARTTDSDSATSQFFINVADNTALDTLNGGYAVFGTLISSASTFQSVLDKLDTIAAVPTQTVGTHADVPVTPVIISDITQKQ